MSLTLNVIITVVVALVLVGAAGYMLDRSVDEEETEKAREEELSRRGRL